jgi:hypothetical protein
MRIILETIPASEARLGEPGDWKFEGDDLIIRCVDLKDYYFNFLLLRHEMDEAVLCRYGGITTEDVDKDQIFSQQHPELENNPDSFSGYPGSVLQNQHNDALASEWQMSRLLDINWSEYADAYEKAVKECEQSGNETDPR